MSWPNPPLLRSIGQSWRSGCGTMRTGSSITNNVIAGYNSDLARAEGELAELGEFINNIDTLITQLIIMQDNMQDKLETNNNSLRIYICM